MMDNVNKYELEISRDNWRALAISLSSVIVAIAIACASYSFGQIVVKASISKSGYKLSEVHDKNGMHYVIEKNVSEEAK